MSEQTAKDKSFAQVLRSKVVDKVSPILHKCDNIKDPESRITIQALCLDIVAGVEKVIEDYQLK